MRFCLLFLLTTLVFAQQQTIPSEFNLSQRKLYEKVTQSVSAPCCRNAIPVAYHESQQALDIREQVKNWILDGKNETQIMKNLDALRMGPDQLPVIFTVPKADSLGLVTWSIPGLILLLGGCVIAFKIWRAPTVAPSLSDDALLDKYRAYIQSQLAVEAQTKQPNA